MPSPAGFLARARSLWRGVHRRDDLNEEMSEEFRAHMQLRADDLVRSGLLPEAATRQARLEFGSAERYKDEGAGARGLQGFDALRVSWLDFKLGFRMLAKYPGLTLVGGLAIAFAIAIGAATFEFISQTLDPAIPLPEGRRIVGIRNWDASSRGVDTRSLHDFVVWRRELKSIEDVSAFRTLEQNLITGDGRGEPVDVAAISGSAFRVARVSPLLGRTLIDSDDELGAPAVVVIGHDLWQSRFASDASIVGRTLQLGGSKHVIVGVMPRGFAFPVSHAIWVPLRLNPNDYERGQGPRIGVFGRLAPEATVERAQAEIASIGRRAARDFPKTHEHLQPQILTFARSVVELPEIGAAGLMSANIFFIMLIWLVCANVALLMFARAATREAEIAVRSALGASRGRIVGQLVAEALVLGGLAGVVGLVVARFALTWWMSVATAEAGGRLPFWFNHSVTFPTVLYGLALAVVGAIIMGVLPALKVTEGGVETRLREAASGGGNLRFGGLWTLIIVVQVAVTVAFPATAFFAGRYVSEMRAFDVGLPTAEYLTGRLEMDTDSVPSVSAARFGATYDELRQRLLTEPGVLGVTITRTLPGTNHPERRIQVDGSTAADSTSGRRVSSTAVALDYFTTVGAPVLSGRGFTPSDLQPERRVVIVNQSFVKRLLGRGNPIGRRVRYVDGVNAAQGGGAWFQIVGVVRDLGMITDDPHDESGLYHPSAPAALARAHLLVHVRGAASSFAPRLRTIATSLDPALRLDALLPLDQTRQTMWLELQFVFRLLIVVSSIALVLSLAGIFSVMSFTVSRRTREIGIRVALGADARRVVAAIFARPLIQVAAGVGAGGMLVSLIALAINSGALSVAEIALVVAYALLMMGVCLLACVVPTRRALRVEPTEALRADG